MKEKRRVGLSPSFPPSIFFSLSFSLYFILFFNLPLFVHLSSWLLFRSFIATMGEKDDDCASLKSKNWRKDRTMKKGRREANRTQDNGALSRTHARRRARYIIRGRMRHAIANSLPLGIPRQPFNGTFLARACFKMAHHLSWDTRKLL